MSSFYLDVYNKILSINNKDIFIVFDEDGDIWFKLRDLLVVLGYNDPKDVIKKLKINKKYTNKIKNLKVGDSIPPPLIFNLEQK